LSTSISDATLENTIKQKERPKAKTRQQGEGKKRPKLGGNRTVGLSQWKKRKGASRIGVEKLAELKKKE